MVLPQGEGWFGNDSIDLTGVKSVNILTGWQEAAEFGFDFEVRLDAPDGKLLGKGNMPLPKKGELMGIAHVKLEPLAGGGFHKLYFIYKPKDSMTAVQAQVTGVEFNGK